jgi:hypothetical protein
LRRGLLLKKSYTEKGSKYGLDEDFRRVLKTIEALGLDKTEKVKVAGGLWTGSGVLGPENFPAEPFIDRMEKYGFPWAMKELDF